MWKIHKILVPTDFSFESMEALSYAIEFVSSFLGVEILLVHVIEPPAHSVPPDGMIPELIGESVRDVSAKRLDEMLAEIPDPIQARSILLEGRPWSEIASLVEQEGGRSRPGGDARLFGLQAVHAGEHGGAHRAHGALSGADRQGRAAAFREELKTSPGAENLAPCRRCQIRAGRENERSQRPVSSPEARTATESSPVKGSETRAVGVRWRTLRYTGVWLARGQLGQQPVPTSSAPAAPQQHTGGERECRPLHRAAGCGTEPVLDPTDLDLGEHQDRQRAECEPEHDRGAAVPASRDEGRAVDRVQQAAGQQRRQRAERGAAGGRGPTGGPGGSAPLQPRDFRGRGQLGVRHRRPAGPSRRREPAAPMRWDAGSEAVPAVAPSQPSAPPMPQYAAARLPW